jgi:hypothetical protein
MTSIFGKNERIQTDKFVTFFYSKNILPFSPDQHSLEDILREEQILKNCQSLSWSRNVSPFMPTGVQFCVKQSTPMEVVPGKPTPIQALFLRQ